MRIFPVTYRQRTISADDHKVMASFDIPANGRLNNLYMWWSIIGANGVKSTAVCGYGIEGWAMPTPDATYSHDYDTLYENYVPTSQFLDNNAYRVAHELQTIEYDNLTITDPDYGSGEDDSDMFESTSHLEFGHMSWTQFFPSVLQNDPAQIYSRERLIDAHGQNLTEADAEYLPTDSHSTTVFKGRRGFQVSKPTSIMFAFSSPEFNLDDVGSGSNTYGPGEAMAADGYAARDRTLEDMEWLLYEFLADTLDYAFQHWMGSTGDGATTWTVDDNTKPFDTAAEFIIMLMTPRYQAENRHTDYFKAMTWSVHCRASWDITVPGRHVMNTISSEGRA